MSFPWRWDCAPVCADPPGRRWPKWTLGRWGTAVNFIALFYTSFICFVLMMPPNELAAKTLAGVVAALALIYVFQVRRKYVIPGWVAEQRPIPGAGQQVLRNRSD